jgi:exosortase
VEKHFHQSEPQVFPCVPYTGRSLSEAGLLFGIAIATDPGENSMSASSVDQNVAPQKFARTGFEPRLRVPVAQLAFGVCLIGALCGVIYYRVLWKLGLDWWQIRDNSHGFLVPLFAGYLVWLRRDALRETEIRPTWSGVAVIALGMSTLLLGDFGADLFLPRVSIVILLTGFTICFGGWALFGQLRFPLIVLLLGVPLPALLLNHVTLPLQTLASKLASDLLPLFGVPVLREGNVIRLPSMQLEVAEACSGIRSLVSLFTMAIFYGYFVEKSNLRRILLVLFSVPIAISANAIRIVGTGLCVQYWDPDKAMGFFHEFSGWVMFLISLACLFLVQRVIYLLWRARQP